MSVSPTAVLDYLRSSSGKPQRVREIARGMRLARGELADLHAQLRALETQGVLFRVGKQRYMAAGPAETVTGRFSATRSGAGFVTPSDGDGRDIFVAKDARGGALDRDLVVVRREVTGPRHRGRGRDAGRDRPRGRVVSVLERGRTTVVGKLHAGPGRAFVRALDPRLDLDVRVARPHGGKDGEVVVARVTDWGGRERAPFGEVERVLGPIDEHGVDVLAVACSYELPLEFPQEVQAEAQDLRTDPPESIDSAPREDLRDLVVFTIDPADAKDHDDALSVRALDGGGWEVGVHIADVSHFVRPGSALDREAYQRGTSVYLVDRVVPMLPFTLASDLCSLVPGEDRLAMSLLVQLGVNGGRRAHRLVRSTIRSRHRLSYEHAQEVLQGTATVDPETDDAIHELDRLTRILRRERLARGSLDFDLPEPHVMLDESGRPTDIQEAPRLESHHVVEDLMLLANEVIAEQFAKRQSAFLYRVHERPEPERLEELRQIAATFGHVLPGAEQITPKSLQDLLAQAADRPEGRLLNRVTLRAMKQARYDDVNRGHFGLAAPAYTHFTSPIRRYPDLVVHRLCAALLGRPGPPALAPGVRAPAASPDPGPGPDRDSHVRVESASAGPALDMSEIARHTSERERIAAEAERDSVELKKVQLMREHLGETFEGTVNGLASFGFFVLLDEYHIEGLVHVSTLDDDYYLYDERTYTLIGERTGRIFRLADRVRVRVVRAALEERQIDFQLMPSTGRPGAPG